jgi:putative serine protease PepD
MNRPFVRTGALVAAAGAIGLGAGAMVGAATDEAGTTVKSVTVGSAQPAAARSSTTLSVSQIARRSTAGVVEVTSTSGSSDTSPYPFGGGQTQAQGSGFVIDSDGHVVTNEHVVDDSSSVRVRFSDGSSYSASVVGTDSSTDLAVLKVNAPASKLHPLTLGDSSSLHVGDGVVAIGSPFGLEGSVTSGIVSALGRHIDAPNGFTIDGAIQTDAAINHGNSGGPLLDLRGEVVGVTSQIESDSGGNEGVGFAVPSSTVRSVVAQLLQSGSVRHAYLGVQVQDASGGAAIAQVRSGSPAAAAGLQAGDVIVRAGGTAVSSASQLTELVGARTPGDKLELQIRRDGQTRTVTVTLGNRPS